MKKILGFILVSILSLGLCACSSPIININSVVINAGEGDAALEAFKSGTMKSYSDVKCGDAFEYFFAGTTWSQFKGVNVSDAIEFDGKCKYQDFEVEVLMQFALSDDGKKFTPEFLSFNQIPQTRDTFEEFLTDIFATYSDYKNGGKGKGTIDTYSPIVGDENSSSEASAEASTESLTQTSPERVEASGSETTDGIVASKEGINYTEAYGDLLALAISSGNSRYYLYDMDRDGILEMILSGTDTIGIYANKIYKPVESGSDGTWSYAYIGEVPNEVEISAAPEGKGFITVYKGDGTSIVERVYIDDSGKIQAESLYEGSNAEGKYHSDGPLKWASASDNSLLEEAMKTK